MVTRVRDQVRSFVEYGGYEENMSVGEILNKSRADRLVLKELEKTNNNIISGMVHGTMSNKLVELPDIDWKSEKYSKRGTDAIEIANDIEQSLSIMKI